MPLHDDTSELLIALRQGDASALDRIMPRVYDELRRIAHRELARKGGGGTLRTTGVVHEAYVRLAGQDRLQAEDRGHFLALAAKAMRHVVIDYSRGQRRQKRGGGWVRISLDDAVSPGPEQLDSLVELHEALERLERFDSRLSRVVECRFFAGLTVEETATALAIAPRTVDRAWQKARAWLQREIDETK